MRDFALEVYFSIWEFAAKYNLAARTFRKASRCCGIGWS
jgi:hypothetical protein